MSRKREFEVVTSIDGEWESLMPMLLKQSEEKKKLREWADRIDPDKVPETVRRYT